MVDCIPYLPPPPPHPVEDLPLLLTLEEFHKIAFTMKTSIKYGLTPEEHKFTPEEFLENVIFPCSLLKNLLKIKASPPKNSILLLALKKS